MYKLASSCILLFQRENKFINIEMESASQHGLIDMRKLGVLSYIMSCVTKKVSSYYLQKFDFRTYYLLCNIIQLFVKSSKEFHKNSQYKIYKVKLSFASNRRNVIAFSLPFSVDILYQYTNIFSAKSSNLHIFCHLLKVVT